MHLKQASADVIVDFHEIGEALAYLYDLNASKD